MARRGGRALLVVDVAVPRDVDPGVGQVFGMTLLDIEALRAFARTSPRAAPREIGNVRAIVTDEASTGSVSSASARAGRAARRRAPRRGPRRSAGPSCERPRRWTGSTRPPAGGGRGDLAPWIVAKLLHEPTVRLKDAAGTARGELLADALADLFDLDDE